MKISKIHIQNYFQFQNLKLDLTYPKGHEKEGQALDKVCIIGQSGTGKTNLLKLIRHILYHVSGLGLHAQLSEQIKLLPEQYLEIELAHAGESYNMTWGANESNSIFGYDKAIPEDLISTLLYFPAGLATTYPNGIKEVNLSNTLAEIKSRTLKHTIYFAFDAAGLNDFWQLAKNDLLQYQLDEADFRVELTREAEKQKEAINITEQLKAWKRAHPNPVEKIAVECLNPILNRFHLAVKTEIEHYRKAEFLQIYSKSTQTVIPYEKLSTGTRQIIYTALPIYQLLVANSIVLMDEPETSFYPDIQQEIINYYTSFDSEKQSQFFFATHSPIIASAFEPWEIVELKFDRTGNIYRELYYNSDKENHVKNYHTDPRYLRWDSILTKVFDLAEEGNEPYRSEMLTEFALLKRKINQLERNGKLQNPDQKAKAIIEEFRRVGELLDWETHKA